MSLHDRIMSMGIDPGIDASGTTDSGGVHAAYKLGYGDARRKAADIVTEADDLIEALADAVRRYESGQPSELQADHAINMYSRYKEQNQ